MSVYNTSLSFNRFEMSIIRILAKRREAARISTLIEGFPDYYLEQVLSAISSLNYRGYILFSDLNTPHTRVYLNSDKREEVLKIIDPLPLLTLIKDTHSHSQNNNSNNNTTDRTLSPVIIRSVAVLSLIFFGFIATLGIGEFSGENQAVNVIYDRHLLKNHDGLEKPVKYQWHFDKEYYVVTNGSLPASYSPSSQFSKVLYPCSGERNFLS
jgi:hypothetical protein